MIPAIYIPSLIALGCGAVGVLVGLFIGLAPEPHLAALRRASRAKTSGLKEGDFVCLEGVLYAAQPLEGAISRESIGVQRLEYFEPKRSRNEDRQVTGETQTATGLALSDDGGRALIMLEEGSLLATRQWRATENSMGDRWARVAIPGTQELVERSITIGAKVLLLGEAAWVNKAWVVRGRDTFLTDVSRAELERSDARSRVTGLVVAALSVLASVVAAVVLAAG
jgi:hypothetical protein